MVKNVKQTYYYYTLSKTDKTKKNCEYCANKRVLILLKNQAIVLTKVAYVNA